MSPTADVSVRPAVGSDAPVLADIQLACWIEEYDGVVPDDALAMIAGSRAEIVERWRTSATTPPGRRYHVLVAMAGPEIVGLAAVGPAEEDAALNPAVVGELLVLLVAPGRRRAGHGSRLLAAAVDHLRGDGFVQAVAWLDDADVAGGTLAGSTGWARDGATRRLDLNGDDEVLVEQARWHTALTDTPDRRDDQEGAP